MSLAVFRVLTGALGLNRGSPGCNYAALVTAQSGYHSLRPGSTGGLKKLLLSAPIGSHKVIASAEGVANTLIGTCLTGALCVLCGFLLESKVTAGSGQ